MATTAALVTRVKNRYNDPTNAILADADWIGYLNDAYSWVQANPGIAKWPFAQTQNKSLVVTAASGGVSALGVEAGTLVTVFDVTDSYPLEPFPTQDQSFAQFPNNPTSPGTPMYYRLQGNNLELWPKPSVDTTVWIEYEGPLTALASGSSDPVFADRHQQTLIEYALYLAYQDDDDEQTAQVHFQGAQALLKDMQTDYTINRTNRNQPILDSFFQ